MGVMSWFGVVFLSFAFAAHWNANRLVYGLCRLITPDEGSSHARLGPARVVVLDDDDGLQRAARQHLEAQPRGAARELETLLWRALCDDPASLRDYYLAHHDCVMTNPLLAPGGSWAPLSKETRPSVVDVLTQPGRRRGGG
ncbi:hypothetical protein MYCTH_2113426 [Thermothelomyces thermophilus ATCC 42464]|uniref:Uncharacterized protein n=1 Tax=Thermothelomyces thermophilus (strain ATCC 42464 / BCRC 31852 / DSM 1799) TaxID=573729 RepID=G2QPK6_THET4|nr:uncharacterized protein MYCTH_2113426 [Thermothelomyces thermophilus ATCC 42464]AEO61519.1 hypothetical protein MYCTH_2113426 [Thermothelomyces thermophilus ATCC 42464]